MGWISLHLSKGESAKAYLDNVYGGIIYDKSGEPIIEHKILKSVLVNFREYYCALSIVDNRTGSKRVIAGVAKIEYNNKDYYDFSYKAMDETSGPFLYNCPESVFNLLTETDNEFAIEWREKQKKIIDQKKILSSMTPGSEIFFKMNEQSETRVLTKCGKIWTDGFYRYRTSILLNRFSLT